MYIYDEPNPLGTVLFALFILGIYAYDYIWSHFPFLRVAYFILCVVCTIWVIYKVIKWIVNKIRNFRYNKSTKRFIH